MESRRFYFSLSLLSLLSACSVDLLTLRPTVRKEILSSALHLGLYNLRTVQAYGNGIDGIFHTDQEIIFWRARDANGPFKTYGDAQTLLGPNGARTPGDWERIRTNTNAFRANPALDRAELRNYTSDAELTLKGNYLRDAALIAAIDQDRSLAAQVRSELLSQLTVSGTDLQTMIDALPADKKFSDGLFENDTLFGFPGWAMKHLLAYDFLMGTFPDIFSTDERATIETRFYDWANMYATSLERQHNTELGAARFTLSYAGNRGTNPLGYKLTKFTQNPPARVPEYTYTDENGVRGNPISDSTGGFNNRSGSYAMLIGAVGLITKDVRLLRIARTWVNEYLYFGAYPDGSVGEWDRNGDYQVTHQGLLYETATLMNAGFLAFSFARNGDPSLYLNSTQFGIFGTERKSTSSGQPKSLRRLMDTVTSLWRGDLRWYAELKDSEWGDALSGPSIANPCPFRASEATPFTPAEECRLSYYSGLSVQRLVHSAQDLYLTFLNAYYRANLYDLLLKRSGGNIPIYPPVTSGFPRVGGGGANGYPWSGMYAIFPGLHGQYTEFANSTFNLFPPNTVPLCQLSVAAQRSINGLTSYLISAAPTGTTVGIQTGSAQLIARRVNYLYATPASPQVQEVTAIDEFLLSQGFTPQGGSYRWTPGDPGKYVVYLKFIDLAGETRQCQNDLLIQGP